MRWRAIALLLGIAAATSVGAQRDAREGPSCALNFGCASGSQIPVGDWPQCSCQEIATPEPNPRRPERPPPPRTPLPPVIPDDECSIHFQCSDGFTMMNWNGRCVCGQEMLPPPR